MKKSCSLFIMGTILLLSFPYSATAQSTGFPCGTDQARQRLIHLHPEILNFEKALEEFTQRYVQRYKNGEISRSAIEPIIIPLVFHIIEQGGAENISDAQILDEVRILNRDYNKQNADTADALWNFKPIIADIGIQFRLANIDPNGNCTDGIVRTYSIQTYQGDDYSKLLTWPRQNYLNVWVVDAMADGFAGYAYFPSSVASIYNLPAMDGVIILSSYIGSIGTSSDLTSRALTHEIGHTMNLEHPWGVTNVPGVACGDDGVDDTPLTKGWKYCPSSDMTNDTALIEICNPPIRENYQNYMEYSYCSVMFTEGQKMRMLAALDTTIADRNNLYTNANLIATGIIDSASGVIDTPQKPCAPIAAFYPSNRYGCLDGYVTLHDNSYNGTVNSWYWYIPNGAPDTSTDPNPKVQFLSPGWQPITLTVTNSYGTSTKTDSRLVYIGYSNTIVEAPYFEGFDDPNVFSDPSQWASVNLDENQTYFAQSPYPHTGTGSAVLNNYFATANHDIDEIVSPPIDLTPLTQDQMNLSFYYSWASGNTNYNSGPDSIVVFGSNNCGASWKYLWSENGAAVLGYWQGYWIPTNESGVWQKVNVSLTNPTVYTEFHQQNVRFMIQVFSSVGGNNFYIDDFSIGYASYTGVENISAISNVTLFPNPSTGQFNLDVQLAQAGKLSVKIVDVTGKEIIDAYEGEMNEGNNPMVLNSTEQLAKGVYIVYIQAGSSLMQRKLVIQ